jgi:hypothetical protein
MVPANIHSLSTVTLLGRYVFDAAVPVLKVVPAHKGAHPLGGLIFEANGRRG